MLYPHFSVLSQFQRFIANSVCYPHFSVLSPFQRFILISAFYPHFSILSPFQRFIPILAFYPHAFQRFISISAFYPHFSFRFQFPFQPFSFSVLSRTSRRLFNFTDGCIFDIYTCVNVYIYSVNMVPSSQNA